MRKLSPEERAQRDAARAEKVKTENRARWSNKLSEVAPLISEAASKLTTSLKNKSLNLRDVWLILGVFEIEEKIAAAGKHESCKTKWFDHVAPRAKPDVYPYHGVSGFSVKTAAKAPEFLAGSRNGYVYLTDLGYAAVLWMRKTFPMLDATVAGSPPYKRGMPIDHFGEVPYPHWREWRNWND